MSSTPPAKGPTFAIKWSDVTHPRTLGRLAGFVALMGVLALLQAPDDTAWWDAVFDMGHVVIFALTLSCFFEVASGVAPAAPLGARLAAAAAVAMIVGVVTELLQRFQPTRDPSIGDVLRDAAGVSIAVLLTLAWFSRRTGIRAACTCLTLVLLAGVTIPFLRVNHAYRARDTAFPVLFRLDGALWEQQFVETGLARLAPHAGASLGNQRLARLSLEPGTYPGIALNEPFPDWRGRRALVLTIVSADPTPLTFRVRIHDANHNQKFDDRFNHLITVTSGVNRIELPIDTIRRGPARRPLDMSKIRGIVLYVRDLDHPAVVSIGAIRLE